MKRAYFMCLLQCLSTTLLLSQSHTISLLSQSAIFMESLRFEPKAQAKISANYGKLPLTFEPQTDSTVRYVSRTSGYTLFLTDNEAVLHLHSPREVAKIKNSPQADMTTRQAGSILRIKLSNSNSAAKVTGLDELPGKSNYFIGNDPAKWRTNAPTYAKVEYKGVYPGIDLVYYGNQRQLEYDFIVAPGADPHRIALDVGGAKRIYHDSR